MFFAGWMANMFLKNEAVKNLVLLTCGSSSNDLMWKTWHCDLPNTISMPAVVAHQGVCSIRCTETRDKFASGGFVSCFDLLRQLCTCWQTKKKGNFDIAEDLPKTNFWESCAQISWWVNVICAACGFNVFIIIVWIQSHIKSFKRNLLISKLNYHHDKCLFIKPFTPPSQAGSKNLNTVGIKCTFQIYSLPFKL